MKDGKLQLWKNTASKMLCMVVAVLTVIVSFEPIQAKELTVQYGDSLLVSVKTRSKGASSQNNPELEKWKSAGKKTITVEWNTAEFEDNEFSADYARSMRNVEKCLGKRVGQSFTIVKEGGDGAYYYNYKILKIKRSKTTGKIVSDAYKSFLASSEVLEDWLGNSDPSALEFATFDIDHNGIKELIVTGDYMYHANIYAYLGGKVTLIDSAFSGSYVYYKNKNLVFNSSAHTGYYPESYAVYKNGRMKVLANAEGQDDFSGDTYKIKYTYYINGKKTTAQKYKAYVKKLKSGAIEGKLTFHKNTTVQRNKWIK